MRGICGRRKESLLLSLGNSSLETSCRQNHMNKLGEEIGIFLAKSRVKSKRMDRGSVPEIGELEEEQIRLLRLVGEICL